MINDTAKEIKSKLVFIKTEKTSREIKLPTKILVLKSRLGKNNRPDKKPKNIDKKAMSELIFLLKKP